MVDLSERINKGCVHWVRRVEKTRGKGDRRAWLMNSFYYRIESLRNLESKQKESLNPRSSYRYLQCFCSLFCCIVRRGPPCLYCRHLTIEGPAAQLRGRQEEEFQRTRRASARQEEEFQRTRRESFSRRHSHTSANVLQVCSLCGRRVWVLVEILAATGFHRSYAGAP